jgi:hypothetical protein
MATRRSTTARKTSRTPLRGRARIALGLVLFMCVAATLVWRRSHGVATARDMQRMRSELRTLRAEQQDLENDLRRASSRRSVVSEAERRLGMRVPSEAQTRFLPSSAFSAAQDVAADSAAGSASDSLPTAAGVQP